MRTFTLGGVHPEENKFADHQPVEEFPIPKTITVYTHQNLGAPPVCQVNKGDTVKTGTLLAKAESFICAHVHSPASGTVARVEDIADSGYFKKTAIVIEVEGDEWEPTIDRSPELVKEIKLTKQEIIQRIKDCGIVGLGGACFPTHVKYMLPEGKTAEYLLINAAECEPYITVDHRIMLEKAEECLIGINALMIASGAKKAKIGIENNKKDAIKHLKEVAKQYPYIEIVPLVVKYPQGAEKQLIKALIKREVPDGQLPITVGAIVNNITTCFAVYEAVQKNKPLIETFLTVTGKKIKDPKNFKVRIGTPIMDILHTVGIPEHTGKIIAGGPMMGKAVANPNFFAMKGLTSLLLLDECESKRAEVEPCIRCGKCIYGCPQGLQPCLLQPLSEHKRFEECEANGALNCCECGSCSFTCPANRPLLDYIRVAKCAIVASKRK
ncbi:MAG: electron transport complex subunit RsxC [Lentimicrobiaceae bacterium]|nr:electron transport complex subunit RsxC [Lentimicrobiaceae bacterium]